MNLFDYKPVVAVPRPQIEKKIKELQDVIHSLQKELAKRGDDEVMKYGFSGIIARRPGVILTGYKAYDSLKEAHKAYMEENPDTDDYTAWYRIHAVYVRRT